MISTPSLLENAMIYLCIHICTDCIDVRGVKFAKNYAKIDKILIKNEDSPLEISHSPKNLQKNRLGYKN